MTLSPAHKIIIPNIANRDLTLKQFAMVSNSKNPCFPATISHGSFHSMLLLPGETCCTFTINIIGTMKLIPTCLYFSVWLKHFIAKIYNDPQVLGPHILHIYMEYNFNSECSFSTSQMP